MQFRTEVNAPRGQNGLVNHSAPVVLVGSCFSDNIGERMIDDGFESIVNPFGPVYNPVSVRNAIRAIVESESVTAESLIEHEGRWHSFSFHSRYSRNTPGEAVDVMNESVSNAREALGRASLLILTLGTTRAFRLKSTGEIVANCHKIPANNFDEIVLTTEDCRAALADAVKTARSMNHALKVIFTVSPLRYLGNGAHDNALSKATLLLAVEDVIRSMENVYYFPAFEIMMDDLRDYRFYADDMKHPSAQAVKYIYEKFAEAYFTDLTRQIASGKLKDTLRLRHRPFNQ